MTRSLLLVAVLPCAMACAGPARDGTAYARRSRHPGEAGSAPVTSVWRGTEPTNEVTWDTLNAGSCRIDDACEEHTLLRWPPNMLSIEEFERFVRSHRSVDLYYYECEKEVSALRTRPWSVGCGPDGSLCAPTDAEEGVSVLAKLHEQGFTDQAKWIVLGCYESCQLPTATCGEFSHGELARGRCDRLTHHLVHELGIDKARVRSVPIVCDLPGQDRNQPQNRPAVQARWQRVMIGFIFPTSG